MHKAHTFHTTVCTIPASSDRSTAPWRNRSRSLWWHRSYRWWAAHSLQTGPQRKQPLQVQARCSGVQRSELCECGEGKRGRERGKQMSSLLTVNDERITMGQRVGTL